MKKKDMNEEDGLVSEVNPDENAIPGEGSNPDESRNQEESLGPGEHPRDDPPPDSTTESEAEVEEMEVEGVEDASGAEAAEPEDVDPSAELEKVQEELRRLRDQHLRLAADFENHRKRASADLSGVWLRAQAELVRALIEGLDDLQRVSRFTSEDTTVDALIEGVDLVERNLLKALTEAGLKVLNPVGERFDPNSMEAMMRVPTEEEGQDETVHQVFQKGYMFKDQLVRPARVSVYMDED